MTTLRRFRRPALAGPLAAGLLAILAAGCASGAAPTTRRNPYMTRHDKLAKGAGIGAVVGGSIGAYMDAQEEKLARIPGTTVERVGEDTLLVHFDSDVLFAVDSAALSNDARATLDDVAGVLQQYGKTAVIVQGHTDSTGSDEHNQELSERRADTVERYLQGRGVDGQRMQAEGFGESSPVADNDTEAGRQRNRRVDVLLRARAV